MTAWPGFVSGRHLHAHRAGPVPAAATRLTGAFALFWLFYEEARKSLGFPLLVPRESEAQETFLYLFLLIYALGLLSLARGRRATPSRQPEAPPSARSPLRRRA